MCEYKLVDEFEYFSELLYKTNESLQTTINYADSMFYDVGDFNHCDFDARKKIENNLFYLDKINKLISDASELVKEIDVSDTSIYINVSIHDSDNY